MGKKKRNQKEKTGFFNALMSVPIEDSDGSEETIDNGVSTESNSERDQFYMSEYSTTYCVCKDGPFKINKNMLAKRTTSFNEFFKEETIIFLFEMIDVVSFFDVLFGFEGLTTATALQIYPIALHYDIPDLKKMCMVQLKPEKMDTTVILTLNLAIRIGCDELKDLIVDYLMTYGINRLFLNKAYYLLLEPKSVLALLRLVYRNPLILKSVIEWGRHYIEKNKIKVDARTFFQENGILNKLSLECLETPSAALELHDYDSKKNVFTEAEILEHIKREAQRSNPTYEWVDIKKGQAVSEKFHLKHLLGVYSGTKIYIAFNSTICDLEPLKDKIMDSFVDINVGITLQYPLTVTKWATTTEGITLWQHDLEGYSMLLSSQKDIADFKKIQGFYTKQISQNMYYESTQCSILPVENIGTAKSRISVNIQNPNFEFEKHLKTITVTYFFRRDCKILKTVPTNLPKLVEANDHAKLYFTCGIDID